MGRIDGNQESRQTQKSDDDPLLEDLFFFDFEKVDRDHRGQAQELGIHGTHQGGETSGEEERAQKAAGVTSQKQGENGVRLGCREVGKGKMAHHADGNGQEKEKGRDDGVEYNRGFKGLLVFGHHIALEDLRRHGDRYKPEEHIPEPDTHAHGSVTSGPGEEFRLFSENGLVCGGESSALAGDDKKRGQDKDDHHDALDQIGPHDGSQTTHGDIEHDKDRDEQCTREVGYANE